MSNFCRSLVLSLINSEIELHLSWPRYCIIPEISKTPADPANPSVPATDTAGATFQIHNVKFYVPVVTLSINDSIKFSENVK